MRAMTQKKTRPGNGKPQPQTAPRGTGRSPLSWTHAEPPSGPEFSIDELAREAGTTVRNVRVYRERGLLPAPALRGRLGVYNSAHLARLRVIGRMLERGYSLANVAELLHSWENGHDIGKLLGLEAAVTSPWTDETPTTMPAAELLKLFGSPIKPLALAKAAELGVIQAEPAGQVRIPSMKMLNVGAALAREGVPLEELLEVVGGLRGNVERVANELVRLIVKYVFDRYGEGSLPPPEEAPRLAELIWQLRPLAMQAVDSEVARAMQKAADRFLGDRLGQILDQLHASPLPSLRSGA
ncbi:MAG: MerR family transcriptional regulator [Stenotrophobium sp.]